MTTPSKTHLNCQDGLEHENSGGHVSNGNIPMPVEGSPSKKTTSKMFSGVRRLSTISEQEPDQPDPDPNSHDPPDGSSFSLCSESVFKNSSSHFSSDESFQPDSGDDFAAVLLACLHCRFHELMDLLPEMLERAVSRCFPSYKYIKASSERDQQGNDCCNCKPGLDYNFCSSCQDTTELIELAMEISGVCFR
ncbi:myoD family inhibitor domain-containing protein 2 [Sphaeramia orbicularis]|uniref:myoD family inhibitor domain-containing protein 2 n=1 Tax=Sphaeramia orbicularis TaxID=375764 RepID=UPI00117C86C3|nr:myoD family inhibitor domain-containing protein 2 [Sphaeramia orbicularis]